MNDRSEHASLVAGLTAAGRELAGSLVSPPGACLNVAQLHDQLFLPRGKLRHLTAKRGLTVARSHSRSRRAIGRLAVHGAHHEQHREGAGGGQEERQNREQEAGRHEVGANAPRRPVRSGSANPSRLG